jgi:hypothetical protein
MAVTDGGKVETTGSMKAFVSAAFDSNVEAHAFIEAVNPLVYHVTDAFVVHMIVDGHAHTAASLSVKAAEAEGGTLAVTEAVASMIIV